MKRSGAIHQCVLSACGLVLAACAPPQDTFVNYERTGGPPPTDDTGDVAPTEADAQTFFADQIEAPLIAACGACHQGGNANFLLPPIYASITSYGFISSAAEQSHLLTYPNTSEHTQEHGGRSWSGLEELRDDVGRWLELEALTFEPEPHLQLQPIEPSGLTTLPLRSLRTDLEDATLTFYGEALGDGATTLWLTDIELWPGIGDTLRVDNITLIVVPPGTQAPPTMNTSLHRAPFDVTAPSDVQIAAETLVTGWSPGARLIVRFDGLAHQQVP